MTRIELLTCLRDESIQATRDLLLPVARQRDDVSDPPERAAEVHLMRLPDSSAAKKKAPYIIHQLISGKDSQQTATRAQATASVRSIFCVYCKDTESEGSLMLLNLMERLRIYLLRKVLFAKMFQLDLSQGLETFVYPDDTTPYYAGELLSVWRLPGVEREVDFIHGFETKNCQHSGRSGK